MRVVINPKAKTADPQQSLAQPQVAAAPAAKTAVPKPHLQAPWTKLCGRDVSPGRPAGDGVCHNMSWFMDDVPQSGLFAAGFKVKRLGDLERDGATVTLTLEFVHPAPNLQVQISGVTVPLAFTAPVCTPDACLREAEVTPEHLAKLYSRETLTVTSSTPLHGQKSVQLSLQGLTAAMGGPKASAAAAREFLAELEIGWRSASSHHQPGTNQVNESAAVSSLAHKVPQLFATRIAVE